MVTTQMIDRLVALDQNLDDAVSPMLVFALACGYVGSGLGMLMTLDEGFMTIPQQAVFHLLIGVTLMVLAFRGGGDD